MRRPAAATLIAAVAVLVALASVAHSGPRIRRRLGTERTAYSHLTAAARRRAPLEAIGVPGAVFDFYSAYTVPGDRIYFQVPPGRRGGFAAAGRFYLFPAIETSDPADATVVLSYGERPGALRLPFLTQRRFGRQQVYVSRVGVP
jgi:hypothetical protein